MSLKTAFFPNLKVNEFNSIYLHVLISGDNITASNSNGLQLHTASAYEDLAGCAGLEMRRLTSTY